MITDAEVPTLRPMRETPAPDERKYDMKGQIAALIAGVILGTAGIATAQGEGNPWDGLQETLDAIAAKDAEQDARLAELERKQRRETNLRIRFDRQLAQCGKLGFRDWTFQGRLVFGPVDKEQVFHCFRDARQNARSAR